MSAEASACGGFRRAAANQGEPPKYERCVCGRLARDHGPTWDDLHSAAAEREDSRRARSVQERITAAVRRAPEAFDREPVSEDERAWVEALGVDPVEVP